MSENDYTDLHGLLVQVDSSIQAFEQFIDATPDQMECWHTIKSMTEPLRFRFDHLRRQIIQGR